MQPTKVSVEARYPDPILAANVYASKLLDDVYRRLVLSLRHGIDQRVGLPECYLWTVRYAKGGEHLKLRLHGPEEARPALRAMIDQEIERFFASCGELTAAESRANGSGAPPIDVEDEVDDLHPDRSRLWIRYRRSHVSLGPEPFLGDDRYAALVTRCLARGLELFLDALERQEGDGAIPYQLRQTVLLKALIAGLATFGHDRGKRAAGYLAYHRDWLLRFFVSDAAEEQRLRDEFDRKIGGMAGTVDQLRKIVSAQWRDGGSAAERSPWQADVSDLCEFLEALPPAGDHRVDPFAPEIGFPALFKVFHGTANQLGLRPLEEAFSHDLLLRASAAEAS